MDINQYAPLIVQSDMSVLLEVMNPDYENARDVLSVFAELEKSPEYMHTYKITPLSLWNAASSGCNAKQVITGLQQFAKHEIPQNVIRQISDFSDRYGKVRLIKEGQLLFLQCDDTCIMTEIRMSKGIMAFSLGGHEENKIPVNPTFRGHIKQELMRLGYPVCDLAGYEEAAAFHLSLKDIYSSSRKLALRPYQIQARDAFYAGGSVNGGSGVVVLPCGAGKTVVGMAIMEKINTETLILTTSITALRQWRAELLDKTTISVSAIGEYSSEKKEIKPLTITTYQILTQRKDKDSPFIHFDIFNKRNWGLIIYDEVHTLPAPVFRVTSEIQSKRRLGLTATLIREDGLEKDVFSLIGSKKYDMPWKSMEKTGFIATATCVEVRIPLHFDIKMDYACADARNKFRIASENKLKLVALKSLLKKHADDNILIIGQYIDQLKIISKELGVPIITGATKNVERDKLYAKFRAGELKILIVSKVANFAIDLPDANVAIETSGTFGSRQEEAQRLGRILRPKSSVNKAWFYTIVTQDTREQEFAVKRQLFLTEQGYKYDIVSYDSIDGDMI